MWTYVLAWGWGRGVSQDSCRVNIFETKQTGFWLSKRCTHQVPVTATLEESERALREVASEASEVALSPQQSEMTVVLPEPTLGALTGWSMLVFWLLRCEMR